MSITRKYRVSVELDAFEAPSDETLEIRLHSDRNDLISRYSDLCPAPLDCSHSWS